MLAPITPLVDLNAVSLLESVPDRRACRRLFGGGHARRTSRARKRYLRAVRRRLRKRRTSERLCTRWYDRAHAPLFYGGKANSKSRRKRKIFFTFLDGPGSSRRFGTRARPFGKIPDRSIYAQVKIGLNYKRRTGIYFLMYMTKEIRRGSLFLCAEKRFDTRGCSLYWHEQAYL